MSRKSSLNSESMLEPVAIIYYWDLGNCSWSPVTMLLIIGIEEEAKRRKFRKEKEEKICVAHPKV